MIKSNENNNSFSDYRTEDSKHIDAQSFLPRIQEPVSLSKFSFSSNQNRALSSGKSSMCEQTTFYEQQTPLPLRSNISPLLKVQPYSADKYSVENFEVSENYTSDNNIQAKKKKIQSEQSNIYPETLMNSEKNTNTQAYAKLEGREINYYINTLTTVLGRQTQNIPNNVVHLGNSKAISRKHAKINYNFIHHTFELQVIGKNGCFFNTLFIPCGMVVALTHKTVITIGNSEFIFLLPRQMYYSQYETDTLNFNSSYISTNTQEYPHHPNITPQRLSLERKISAIQDSPVITHQAASPSEKPFPSLLSLAGNNSNNSINPVSIKTPNLAKTDINTPVKKESGDSKTPKESKSNYKAPDPDKPVYSYASMIAQAIMASSKQKLTLSDIYNYITTNFEYYRTAQNGWQNSIRHNLSLNKAFVKLQRSSYEPGKGAYWAIDEKYRKQFVNGVYKRMKRSTNKKNS
ncbi:hypothetical protein BB561_004787 [Smittium simulii]|uniref:Fork-head domain-containing protein n=1 Tax=Smittium simulii TaxID=133385 RepID=A0A2T9YEA5_9FUNG|nr:hypothetical protein BB561_004787 [Smittium simulii]